MDMTSFHYKGMEITVGENVLRDFVIERLTGTPPATAAGKVPRIGEYWVGQGGVNAGLMRGVNGEPDYYLIVPPKSHTSLKKTTWGPYNKSVEGASDQYDGLKNPKALLAMDEEYPAAKACAEFALDGHQDFYLGARREYALAYANVPELFETSDWYWSSTHSSDSLAWGQHFDFGGQTILVKDFESFVRPVRRLPANSVI